MEKRTIGMIEFLKHHGGEYKTLRKAAIAYMMDYSGCHEEVYAQSVIEEIIFEIFCDFMNSVDRPSIQLREMADSMRFAGYCNNIVKQACLIKDYNIFDAMLSAMRLVQVKDDNGKYINGFKAENFEDDR